ncbi:MAG: hypothetical protein NZ765_06880 [Anaerolineae bacterium]|nr:hypothetical protein [Anaerolineae bacterium]MDW8070954.1 hypothetical protein [Anaerolineae bacterium]
MRVERTLPTTAEVLVQEGERVRATQVIARATPNASPHMYIVDVAGALDLPERDVSSAMVKQRGEHVHVGELLAVRRSALPFAYRACRSPVAGRVRTVWYGWAVIETDAGEERSPVEITAQVDGYIVAVAPARSVTIETEAAWIEGACGIAGETYGVLQVVRQSSAAPLTPEQLPADATGAILVVDSCVTPPVLERAVALGVKGVIAAGIPAAASDVAALPVMATEGYGAQRMAPEWLRLFRALEGSYASLIVPSPHLPPWLRRRPVVIISRTSGVHPKGDLEDHLRQSRPLCQGERVRAVRAPLAGRWGTIATEIKGQQLETPSGVISAGVAVRFSPEVLAWLPYLNLERIVGTAQHREHREE